VGAYESWPRSRRFPRPGRIRLEFGRVLTVDEVAALDEQALVAECTRRLVALDARGRAALAGERVRESADPPAGPA
jgi:hypothetical protein